MTLNHKSNAANPSRRQFLKTGALAAGSVLAASTGCNRLFPNSTMGTASSTSAKSSAPAILKNRKPNILFITADQLGIDAISAHGCAHVQTPNIDRLVRRGVSFTESYSSNPVCSPARSSWYTGRMPVETGVVQNGLPIHPSRPNLGQWLTSQGYDAVYTGKWHVPDGYPVQIKGFTILPVGDGQGHLTDTIVARNCQAYLSQRSRQKPFALCANLLQPHDICFFGVFYRDLVPPDVPFSAAKNALPNLAPSHNIRLAEPEKLAAYKPKDWTDRQWQYYSYAYFRQVEMLDVDIGRILDALDRSGEAENTMVIFTSDHGESRGRHGKAGKWTPYDEAAKVPLILSWPGRIAEGRKDEKHLVSGMDILPTMCELVGVKCPPITTARSLAPLLQDKQTDWRDYLVFETQVAGRVVCTNDYKYVEYEGDSQRQLFDRQSDPWETKNIINEPFRAQTVTDHQKLLAQWNARMEPVPVPAPIRKPKEFAS